jgi:hypothetical protein
MRETRLPTDNNNRFYLFCCETQNSLHIGKQTSIEGVVGVEERAFVAHQSDTKHIYATESASRTFAVAAPRSMPRLRLTPRQLAACFFICMRGEARFLLLLVVCGTPWDMCFAVVPESFYK